MYNIEKAKGLVRAGSREEGAGESTETSNETPSSIRRRIKQDGQLEKAEGPGGSALQDSTKKQDDSIENKGEPSKPTEIDDDHFE